MDLGRIKYRVTKKIISARDIIAYARFILSEDLEQFSEILGLSIAEENEVEEILSKLVLNENVSSEQNINSKWIFVIIYESMEKKVKKYIENGIKIWC